MADEHFFARWSRRKAEAAHDKTPAATLPPAAPEQTGASAARLSESSAEIPAVADSPPLTLDDVARLTPDSDYTPFLARGVDEAVKRSALKRLFADPQFNVMDGLDTYIEDYNKFVPLQPQVLAALRHARDLLQLPASDDGSDAEPGQEFAEPSQPDLNPDNDEHQL